MSFATDTRQRTSTGFPLASMIDIMFLLLIFFMTASVFREQELSLTVALTPSESAEETVDPASQIIVTVTKEDKIFLGQREVTLDELPGVLREIVAVSPTETLVVRADEDSRTGVFGRIVDQAELAGIRETRFAMIRGEAQ